LRILHVTRTYFPDSYGGIEEVVRQISLNTEFDGVESRIFALSKNPNPSILQREEAKVFRSQFSFSIASCDFSVRGLSDFKELAEWADIVHYHFPWPYADLLHFHGRVKKKSIVTYHSDVVRQKRLASLYKPLMRSFLDSVDKIVATSSNYLENSQVLQNHIDKTTIIPIGLSEESYPIASEVDLVSMKEKVGNNFFLFIGSLREYKGLNILLDALQNTDLECVIAGSGSVENQLKAKAQLMNLNNVHFLGQVNDVEKVALLKLCRVVVSSSNLPSEAFGVSLVEGLMFGKPLITTELGTGTSYVNADKETGLIVPHSNPRALREAMLHLASDSILLRKMGEAARMRYEKLFKASLMGDKYLRLYNKLLQSKKND